MVWERAGDGDLLFHAKTVGRCFVCRFRALCSRYDADATFSSLPFSSRHGRIATKVHILPVFPSISGHALVTRHLHRRPPQKRSPHPPPSWKTFSRNGPKHGLSCFRAWNATVRPQVRQGQKRDSFCNIHCSSMRGLDERILRTARHSTMKLSGSLDLNFTFFFFFLCIYYYFLLGLSLHSIDSFMLLLLSLIRKIMLLPVQKVSLHIYLDPCWMSRSVHCTRLNNTKESTRPTYLPPSTLLPPSLPPPPFTRDPRPVLM